MNLIINFAQKGKRRIVGAIIWLFDKLKDNERSIISHQPNWPTSQWLEQRFYPPNKGKYVAPADKLFILFVILSLLAILIEDRLEVDFPGAKITLSVSFLLIFSIEFVLRFYVKGRKYFSPWGIIDFFAMSGDIIFLGALTFSGEPFNEDWDFILRLLRILRFIRLLRYILYIPLIKAKWKRFKLYAGALLKVLFILTLIIATPAFLGYAFFDANIKKLVDFIIPLLNPFHDFENLSSQTDGDTKPDIPKKEAEEILGDVYQLFIIVLTFVIMNIIAMLFAPMARSIAKSSQDDIIDKILNDHIIIYIDKDHDLLEEFIYVFEKYTQRQVIYILNPVENFDTPFPSGALTRKGDFDSRSTWMKINAALSNTIVFFNCPNIEVKDIVYTIIESENGTAKMPRFIQVNETCIFGHKHDEIGDIKLMETNIPIGRFREILSDTIWNHNSIQYAFYTDLIDDWDEKFEFPSNHRENNCNFSLEDIDLDNVDKNTALIEIKGNNLLVKPPEQDEKSDSFRVYLVKELLEKSEKNKVTKNINIFCFVNDFYLFDFNKDFQRDKDFYVCIVAVEFAIALAVLHEMQSCGSIEAWFSSPEELEQKITIPSSECRGEYRERSDIDEGRKALCLMKQNGEIHCYKDELHQMLIEEGDRLLFSEYNKEDL